MFVSVFILFTCTKVHVVGASFRSFVQGIRFDMSLRFPFIHFSPSNFLLLFFQLTSFRFSLYFYIFSLIAESCFSFHFNLKMFVIVSHLHTSFLKAYGIVIGKHENDRAHITVHIFPM